MISKKFFEPNFKCRAVDCSGQECIWLTWAGSEDELRLELKKFEDIGYKIKGIEEYAFNQWREKAKENTQKAVEAVNNGEKPEFNQEVWGQLKEHLFELFHGKCAYCESKLLHVASGEVEHYRPKRQVSENPGHPGYYWLAYDVDNLLPCCEKCNRTRGKQNHFPVKVSHAYSPEELHKEEPLLLNPYFHQPSEHLKFIPGTMGNGKDDKVLGTVEGITEIGKTSIKIYKLNRFDLVDARKKELESIEAAFGCFAFSNWAKLREIIEEIRSGKRPYSAAGIEQLNYLKETIAALLED
ncbi:MAG TPA: hypothetical protein VK186_21955 [Candidatus Deferrimicrobium sp.]|nr:hypothetical protein [Candidatus Deferrimicrobium sp.]